MNYVCILKFLFNPDKRFLQQKLDDHRKQSAILTIVIATTGTSLWLWDYVTDPIGAMNTIWLRAAIPVFAIPCVAALLLKVNIRWMPAVAFIAALGCEVMFLEILNRLNNGMIYGLAGFMYFFFMGILLMETLSLRANLTYTLCVAVLPHILDWTGFVHNFQRIQYSALVWPAVNMVMIVQVIMAINHWRRQDYQSRLALQEEALQKTNNELELRVQERTAKLHLSEAKYRRFIDTANEGVWGLDIGLRTDFVNAQMAKLLGYTSDEMFGRPLDDFMFEEDLASHRKHMEQFRRGGSEHYEQRFRCKDGSELWALISATAIIDDTGDFRGAFAMLTDITERKCTEEALSHYKDQLEETVQQRTEELRLARDTAEAANKTKSVFLANMSHELRTPLNAVLGFSQLIKNDPEVAASQKEHLEIITRSGEHLQNLINNVLDISKIESGRVELEESPIDLLQLMQEVASLMEARAHGAGLDFMLEPCPYLPRNIIADGGKLRQVLLNLVGNGIKYTQAGSVTLRAMVLKQEPPEQARVRFEVADTGPGISMEERDRIFFPFVQLGDRPVTDAGSGLGLAICRQFVELMGGKIGVSGQAEEGSVFHFEIPVTVLFSEAAPAKTRRGRVIGTTEGTPRYRILIAEDQPDNRLLLRKLLEPLDLDLREAVTGEEAVTLFQQWHPQLTFMDIRMPVMDGLEATRRIKATDTGAHARIVALTAHALEEERREILTAGCDDFIRKPYRDFEILDALTKHLGVQFIYEAEAVINPVAAPLDIAALVGLPHELLKKLEQALSKLDIGVTGRVIEEIRTCNISLADALASTAQDLQFGKILRLIRSTSGKNSPENET